MADVGRGPAPDCPCNDDPGARCTCFAAGREATPDCDRSAVCLADQHEPSCISQMSWADREAGRTTAPLDEAHGHPGEVCLPGHAMNGSPTTCVVATGGIVHAWGHPYCMESCLPLTPPARETP